MTKRSVLSQTAKLFDPLGLLGPVIASAKILIQDLWKAKVGWDDPIPADFHDIWVKFKNQLPLLNNVRFKRCIIIPDVIEIQIPGFCDASEKAYGASLILRSTNKNNEHQCVLICSKSRVAPLATPITIPKLELCAAALLTNLYKTTVKALQMSIDKTYFSSDSTIALGWIKSSPNTLKTFVANRVTDIQSVTQPHTWLHVPTRDNPADLISRGQSPKDFLQTNLWRSGPDWLSQDQEAWPSLPVLDIELPEKKSVNQPTLYLSLTLTNDKKGIEKSIDNLLEKYPSLRTIKNIVAYCQRFITNCRIKVKEQRPPTLKLTIDELDTAMITILKIVQHSSFPRELRALSQKEELDRKSPLLSLNAFLHKGVIRVGGRLEKADIPLDKKYPIVLPRNHPITILIIREEHLKMKLAGAQATLYSIRERFWPIDGRNITRHVIRKCVKCFRARPRGFDYIMGNLPEKRLSFAGAFLNAGVDYCGPFYIREKRHRNLKKEKTYVVIFICFATKALHLELVCDLTTEAFIGCLSRFFSRRGKANTLAVNRLSAWQLAQQLEQYFWSRWYKEYLNELITRSKWKGPVHQDSIKVNTLVVIKDDNLPPLCWKLGRITEFHPAPDGLVRVVTSRTSTGTFKRCIQKLYPLPISAESERSISRIPIKK